MCEQCYCGMTGMSESRDVSYGVLVLYAYFVFTRFIPY